MRRNCWCGFKEQRNSLLTSSLWPQSSAPSRNSGKSSRCVSRSHVTTACVWIQCPAAAAYSLTYSSRSCSNIYDNLLLLFLVVVECAQHLWYFTSFHKIGILMNIPPYPTTSPPSSNPAQTLFFRFIAQVVGSIN